MIQIKRLFVLSLTVVHKFLKIQILHLDISKLNKTQTHLESSVTIKSLLRPHPWEPFAPSSSNEILHITEILKYIYKTFT